MAWQIDPYHLQVEFAVKHFGMMTVRGHFGEVSATGQIDPQRRIPGLGELDAVVQYVWSLQHSPARPQINLPAPAPRR